MKQFFLISTLVMFAWSAAAQTVTFTAVPMPVGATAHMADTLRIDGTITVSAQGQEQSFDNSRHEARVYSKTVLALDGNAITKYRVAYEDAYKSEAAPMRKPKETRAPVTASPYVFERLAEGADSDLDSATLKSRRLLVLHDWMVMREDGKPISEEEEAVLDSDKGAKMENGIKRFLDGRTMEVGETLTFDDEMLKSMADGVMPGNLEAREMSLHLKAVETVDASQVALFDFHGTLGGTTAGMEVESTMEGEVRIGVDNLWPTSLDLKGTLVGAGMHQGATMGMDGDIRMIKRASYEME